jgi:hypothetical protein
MLKQIINIMHVCITSQIQTDSWKYKFQDFRHGSWRLFLPIFVSFWRQRFWLY